MNILEISTARIWGGGEVHLRALCFGLLRRGHDVAVACKPGTPVHEVLAADGLPLLPLEEDGVRDLARACVSRRIDVIHAHQSKGAELAVAARYRAGRPYAVLTRHALGPPDDGIPAAGLARIIAVSRAVADDCLAAGFTAGRVKVVPNGVDVARFRPGIPPASRARLGLPPEVSVVVLTGRLSKEKGCLHALAALLPLLREDALHLVILGDGEERGRLERLAAKNGAGDRVLFLGQQPDVRPFLALADAVVSPGPREAFGLATLEAMAMGRAVVAVDAGGVPEVIEDGRDGLLVPPGDGLALAAAVYRLAGDEELRRTLGEGARKRAMEFSEERMVERTEEVMRGAGVHAERRV
ncbi:MAG: glycosyltransferase family 4 protein [Bacteroidota bacterium]